MTELKNTINAKVLRKMATVQLATTELNKKMIKKLVSNEGAITDYAGAIAIGLGIAGVVLTIVVVLLKTEVAPGLSAKFKEFFATK